MCWPEALCGTATPGSDYFNTYVQNIARVTRADVERVATQYLHPDRMAIVVVGDRETIEQPRHHPWPAIDTPARPG